jgi:hypothetical protein
MNKLLVHTISFLFDARFGSPRRRIFPPRFRAIPDVSSNQVQSTEQPSQTAQVNDSRPRY